MLGRLWVSWQIQEDKIGTYLRLILFRKKRYELLYRPFQMFLRYGSFSILPGPSDPWGAANLGIVPWWWEASKYEALSLVSHDRSLIRFR